MALNLISSLLDGLSSVVDNDSSAGGGSTTDAPTSSSEAGAALLPSSHNIDLLKAVFFVFVAAYAILGVAAACLLYSQWAAVRGFVVSAVEAFLGPQQRNRGDSDDTAATEHESSSTIGESEGVEPSIGDVALEGTSGSPPSFSTRGTLTSTTRFCVSTAAQTLREEAAPSFVNDLKTFVITEAALRTHIAMSASDELLGLAQWHCWNTATMRSDREDVAAKAMVEPLRAAASGILTSSGSNGLSDGSRNTNTRSSPDAAAAQQEWTFENGATCTKPNRRILQHSIHHDGYEDVPKADTSNALHTHAAEPAASVVDTGVSPPPRHPLGRVGAAAVASAPSNRHQKKAQVPPKVLNKKVLIPPTLRGGDHPQPQQQQQRQEFEERARSSTLRVDACTTASSPNGAARGTSSDSQNAQRFSGSEERRSPSSPSVRSSTPPVLLPPNLQPRSTRLTAAQIMMAKVKTAREEPASENPSPHPTDVAIAEGLGCALSPLLEVTSVLSASTNDAVLSSTAPGVRRRFVLSTTVVNEPAAIPNTTSSLSMVVATTSSCSFAGLCVGDIVVDINGRAFAEKEDLVDLFVAFSAAPGDDGAGGEDDREDLEEGAVCSINVLRPVGGTGSTQLVLKTLECRVVHR